MTHAEVANKDGMWLRDISSCCCLTTAGKIRQLLLNKIYIPFLPSLYFFGFSSEIGMGVKRTQEKPVLQTLVYYFLRVCVHVRTYNVSLPHQGKHQTNSLSLSLSLRGRIHNLGSQGPD